MPIHPFLNPALSEKESVEKTLGPGSYDPKYKYRLALEKRVPGFVAEGWEIIGDLGDSFSVIRKLKETKSGAA